MPLISSDIPLLAFAIRTHLGVNKIRTHLGVNKKEIYVWVNIIVPLDPEFYTCAPDWQLRVLTLSDCISPNRAVALSTSRGRLVLA